MIQVGDLVEVTLLPLKRFKRHGIVTEIKGKYHAKIVVIETGKTEVCTKGRLTKIGEKK